MGTLLLSGKIAGTMEPNATCHDHSRVQDKNTADRQCKAVPLDTCLQDSGPSAATNRHQRKKVLKSLIYMTNREDVGKGICDYTDGLYEL
jgi:hypothetical protein